MRVRLEGKTEEIALEGPLLGRGGEASIYNVPGRMDLAAKIYHNPTDEQADKLAAMLAAPPVPPPSCHRPTVLAWPTGRLLESDDAARVVGYLMPRIDNAHLIWEIYNPGVRREVCPHFHQGSLLRTARNLAAVVRTLHECGYVLGDLNESNVLVTSQAHVTLIDADSFQIPGTDRLFRCRVGRPEYCPPELQGVAFAEVDRLPQHDAFALAVLIFQLLMHGIHPFAGTYPTGSEPISIAARIAAGNWPYAWGRTPSIQPSPHAPPWCALPPTLQELMRLCFEDTLEEPDLRPSAAQWQQALEEAETQLTICSREEQHVFPRGLDRCPWCTSSSAIRKPRLAARAVKPNRESRKTVDDPLPPRPEFHAAKGGMETALQAIGVGLERRSWLVWFGMALIGAVVGMVYAMQRALPGSGVP